MTCKTHTMQTAIFPMAYAPVPGLSARLYRAAFPAAWKERLLEMAAAGSCGKGSGYLSTQSLKTLIEQWMPGTFAIRGPIGRSTDDSAWLTSFHPFSDHDLDMLCEIVRTWTFGEFVSGRARCPEYLRAMAGGFCEAVSPEDLRAGLSDGDSNLVFDDGTVSRDAFDAIPLMAAERLSGQKLMFEGHVLELCRAGSRELIAKPITVPGSGQSFSIRFGLSLQTTPPSRRSLLVCHIGTARWASRTSGDGLPYIADTIHAYVKGLEGTYGRIGIRYAGAAGTRSFAWDRVEKARYDMHGYRTLPDATDVVRRPQEHADQVLLPFRNGMDRSGGMDKPRIDTGIAIREKAGFHGIIGSMLSDVAASGLAAERVRAARASIGPACLEAGGEKQPWPYGDGAFGAWAASCTGADRIMIEIFGNFGNQAEDLMGKIAEEEIHSHFGSGSMFRVDVVRRNMGGLADPLDGSPGAGIARAVSIRDSIGNATGCAGCLVMLPAAGAYADGRDPKRAIRHGLALSGRVSQFLNPPREGGDAAYKIKIAILDLYRQLGITFATDRGKIDGHAMADVQCFGLHRIPGVVTAEKPRTKLDIPLWTHVDLRTGRVIVHCDAFPRREVPYRDACLELAKLYWTHGLAERCRQDTELMHPARGMLVQLAARFPTADDRALVLVQAEGGLRTGAWTGITDTEIGNCRFDAPYMPERVNAGGNRGKEYQVRLGGTGVRIIRFRCNEEVPDYFTSKRGQEDESRIAFSMPGGVFRYEDVFWCIAHKPGDKRYRASATGSRLDQPGTGYVEQDMIEVYHVQLQEGDDPGKWAVFADSLRKLPLQFQKTLTKLPLPLHLARCLGEYVFDGT